MLTHRWILGACRASAWVRALVVGLLALAGPGAHAQCPTALVERFISADCEACWRAGNAPAPRSVVLDWIVPSPRGDEAPLSAVALPEASSRATGLAPNATLLRQREVRPRGLTIIVEDGPPWQGYMGLRLTVEHRGVALPAGAVGFLALVETVRAGEEGSPIERGLVRAMTGPLTLVADRDSTIHLIATRLPQGARGDRLGAVGWVEDGSGRVIALARSSEEDCASAR